VIYLLSPMPAVNSDLEAIRRLARLAV
jgi:hypothetical protein